MSMVVALVVLSLGGCGSPRRWARRPRRDATGTTAMSGRARLRQRCRAVRPRGWRLRRQPRVGVAGQVQLDQVRWPLCGPDDGGDTDLLHTWFCLHVATAVVRDRRPHPRLGGRRYSSVLTA